MSHRPLTEAEQDAAVEAVAAMSRLVDGGDDPTAAAVKVARARGLGEGDVEIMCNSFNIGRQLHQWGGGSALEKLAGYKLADARAAAAALFAPPRAAEVADEYHRPPDWLKAARAAPPKPEPLPLPPGLAEKAAAAGCSPAAPPARPDRKARELDRIRRDEIALRAAKAAGELESAADAVRLYFRRPASVRCSYPAFKEAAEAYRGPEFAPLVEHAGRDVPAAEKSAGYAVDDDPRAALVLLDRCKRAADRLLAADRELARLDARLDPAAPAPDNGLLAIEKPANMAWPFASSTLGATLGASLGQAAAGGGEDEVQSVVDKLDDPQTLAEVRRIRAQAALSRLLTDRGDPISGYPPEQVLSVFNDASQLAPRAMAAPGVMGPVLRRSLAGHQEPFEASQLVGLERDLSGLNKMPSGAPNA